MSQATLLPTEQIHSPFCFQNHPIRTRIEKDQLWFVAKDVCSALGIGWAGTALSSIPKSWQGMWDCHTPSGNQRVKFISEPAVYKLAFRSNKPEADSFTTWVASEVMPAIRKTGSYSPQAKLAPSTTATRKPLEKIIKVWVMQSGMAHPQCWTMLNAHFGLERIGELPEAWIPDAIAWVQERIEACGQRALPAVQIMPASKTYLDRIDRLSRLEQEYSEFIGATSRRIDDFAAEYRSITQGTYTELLNAVTPAQTIPRDGLLDVLTSTSYSVGRAVRDQLEDLRYAIRAAKTANKLMLG